MIIYGQLNSFRGEGSFEGGMYRITRRVATRRYRITKRRASLGSLPAPRVTAEVYNTDPVGRVDREHALTLIHKSVNELPARQREVFDLCDLQGRRQSEVADMLAIKAVTVRANLFKARASIRRNILRMHPRYSEHRQ